MRKKVILVTGSSGEVGQALLRTLAELYPGNVLSLDIKSLPTDLNDKITHFQGDILDRELLDRLISEYQIEEVYHLAALLSTRAEFTPEAAHRVNVTGTMNLLEMAAQQSEWLGKPVRFIFPSSIAAFGMPDLDTKARYERVREWEWNYPRTMYGCNKLYCEMLGIYFSQYLRQLAAEQPTMLDFRCVRFPGLISAFTLPSGGTSDYGPEMLHAAAQGLPYECFVRADVRIPFMAMPDAVKALLDLARAPVEDLSRQVYNVTSFSLSAGEFSEHVRAYFPEAQISYKPDTKRQAIVDSWPADLDDSAARRDWNWKPDFDVDRAFREYLVPKIHQRYQQAETTG